VLVACEELLHLTREERAALGFMHPGRVDVIGAGALVWHEVVRRLADLGVRRVVASEHDILDGIALSAAGS
jgi:exopolyphosphatase/guanosine-5'-triphosphate,3'-diphosphate pyrophosphatase